MLVKIFVKLQQCELPELLQPRVLLKIWINTQGKAFRENQVAEYLTDLFFQIEKASLEIERIRKVYDKVNIDLTVR